MSEEPWIEERPVVIDAEVTHVTPEAFPALPSSEENNKTAKDGQYQRAKQTRSSVVCQKVTEFQQRLIVGGLPKLGATDADLARIFQCERRHHRHLEGAAP